ncbi:MFS transporter [Roseateles puraquae]|uniref:MFS transporter n=1 Tax=Roseateles puraquae TaxID=431059 RepID=A0A254N9D4_9BURK|nr:MFS transporter [Roseateles puraquae]MDG0855279.1 MFS transporter [Roseateles puraquae]MDG0855306.1 MFS transporter [Roseateles puraquae]OWR01733.1 MFS transporter [Roseateles puraquae]
MNDPRRELFGNANFRWLLGGGLLSMLGDQFTLLALPWLVMSLSNDPLVLGTVLALGSLPRALFILVGGALVDRHSPKTVLLLTKWINFGLLALLAGLTAHGGLTLPLVYALTLAIGLATAFSYPAGSAILPQAVPAALIQPANGVLMGARQLVLLLGPVLAGLLVTGGGGPALQGQGLAMAFGFDAVSFAISAWTLSRVRTAPREVQDAQPVLGAIAESMRACWQDRELRALFLYFAAIAFFVGGPIQVALPVLAAERLPGGAAALGVMLAAHGLGALAGMAVSGLRPQWRLTTLGGTVLMIDAIAGGVFLLFGHVHAAWQGALLLLPLGALGGFVQVAVYSWLQRRIPPQMLGRSMALFMFIVMGLAPLASAAAGAALRVLDVTELFTAASLCLLAVVTLGALLTPIRQIAYLEAPPRPSAG